MKIFIRYTILASYFILSACGGEHNHDHKDHSHGEHAHEAPHGGTLVLLGKHGSGFHLEVILSKEGLLDLYVLDGEVEEFVRIPQEQLDLQVKTKDTKNQVIHLLAVADSTTGESTGNTSHFQVQTEMKDVESFDAVLSSVTIKGTAYEKVSFRYPDGNE